MPEQAEREVALRDARQGVIGALKTTQGLSTALTKLELLARAAGRAELQRQSDDIEHAFNLEEQKVMELEGALREALDYIEATKESYWNAEFEATVASWRALLPSEGADGA